MNGPQQGRVLPPVVKWLALACAVFLIALVHWQPTVDGMPLNEAELSRSMDQLKTAESGRFYLWLSADCVFALLYTVLFTWLLRWRAAGASDVWGFVGRFLSWFTALAVLFDLSENAILWTAASTAASEVSPWLSYLVHLKWSPAIVVALYCASEALFRAWPRDAPRS